MTKAAIHDARIHLYNNMSFLQVEVYEVLVTQRQIKTYWQIPCLHQIILKCFLLEVVLDILRLYLILKHLVVFFLIGCRKCRFRLVAVIGLTLHPVFSNILHSEISNQKSCNCNRQYQQNDAHNFTPFSWPTDCKHLHLHDLDYNLTFERKTTQ